MNKKGARNFSSPVVLLLFLGLVCLLSVSCTVSIAEEKSGSPGVIFIDRCADFGSLERPPVAFPHDAHTAALPQDDDVCARCHAISDDGKMSFSYLGTEGADKDTLVNRFHDDCVGCHRETTKAGQKSGPVTCGECHARQPKWKANAQDTNFMKTMHAFHVEANMEACDTCHHIYDEEAQALTYEPGEERNCRECHKAEGTDEVPSFKNASHASCVGCHREYELSVTCAGCHSGDVDLSDMTESERLPGSQPDFMLVSAAPEDLASSRMKTVPFDHAAHEQVTDSCRDCHHNSLEPCSSCHRIQPDDKGGGVNLQQAMHSIKSTFSCVGCHNRAKKETSCAGCHELMEQGRLSQHSCEICHQGPLPSELASIDESTLSMDQFRAADMAMTFTEEDIPDDVTIGVLSKKFEEVWFPHSMHVERLMGDIAGSPMAVHFHGHEDVVCQGCHHHTPVGTKPPLCGNCHGEPFNTTDPFRPGLLAAYHLQCNECHRNMDIMDASDCEVCHAKIE